ncbi:Hypothetical predicted protein [Marmota monax]|uniref:Uncharacterized protein n=1 Tax=Marmota monax TaxID=9995 RepID=A0A5E4CR58_MARMO|nr:hypothetical protein GHT09_016624 [Marmota monax]VTJ83629.1 Hypothetical predicted protein [Marmota monax]
MDASRERRENESSWFCRMCVARCQLGLGPLPSLFPWGLCQATFYPSLPSEASEHTCSCLYLGPCPGWGLAPHLDQSCQQAARPLQDSILMAVALLGPYPVPSPHFPRGNRAWCH